MSQKVLYNPGDIVTFTAAKTIPEPHPDGRPVELCNDNHSSVIPILDGSSKFIGIALNGAAPGEDVQVEVRVRTALK